MTNATLMTDAYNLVRKARDKEHAAMYVLAHAALAAYYNLETASLELCKAYAIVDEISACASITDVRRLLKNRGY